MEGVGLPDVEGVGLPDVEGVGKYLSMGPDTMALNGTFKGRPRPRPLPGRPRGRLGHKAASLSSSKSLSRDSSEVRISPSAA